jgi:hypothetical protein
MRPGTTQPVPEPGLSTEQVEAWVRREAAPGQIVVMQWQRKVREFFLDEIANLNFHKRRLTLTRHGRFDLEGRSMDVPKNALMLCVPTADVLDAAATGRTWLDGRFMYKRQLSPQERRLAGLIVAATSVQR